MMEVSGESTETMGVEELKAILEAKDGVMEEEEIIYATEEADETDDIEGINTEEIVEIIEEIEVVEGEEEEEDNTSQLQSQSASDLTEIIDGDSVDSQDVPSADERPEVKKRKIDNDNRINYSQRVITYDAEEDWSVEENDPLEIKSNKVEQSSKNSINTNFEKKVVPINGNTVATTKPETVYRVVKSHTPEYEQGDLESPHEIVKNAENDLVYTVLGSKKQNESSKQREDDPRYIKMERLDEDTIPVEGTIYYEGDDMGTLYMAHSINDGETYMYDENNLEQEQTADHEQQEQQEHWDGTNEAVVHEQGEEENAQDQIFLHEDEEGQLYFKDENGTMQPVYLTEDGNYAIADNSSDDQENQENKALQKSRDGAMEVQDEEASSLKQIETSTSSLTNNDVENEDNTVTISLIISEDENGLKRTQVIIPTNDALKCEICQKSFKTQLQLLRHSRLKHAREEDITTRNFPCDLCPKRYPDQNSLARHRKTHTGDRPFQCLECQQTFPTASALRRHMGNHNPESKPLPCIYCGRRFLDKPSLQKHEESHLAGELQRTHNCEICHKSFMTAADLSLHKKNHDPDKKFDCEVCGREFNRLNNLQRHMLVHQQVREKAPQQGQNQEILSCDVCGITYKFMSSLTRHMVTSHMNPEKLRQQAEEQRRKRENNYKRYLENRKMYETQHGTGYGKRSYRNVSSDPDDDLA
ncbi:hypothetical protein PV328_006488 [Microctonus aethiopoides]|uniref:C2H2-type domain-containing protein n=1 Tax=Microctonus aethiopoides TaxID=144406 RepID=A0AA39FP72_9HYME|nr:hypothetical protein PV328_006488 [Microctonus aethiopoides]